MEWDCLVFKEFDLRCVHIDYVCAAYHCEEFLLYVVHKLSRYGFPGIQGDGLESDVSL